MATSRLRHCARFVGVFAFWGISLPALRASSDEPPPPPLPGEAEPPEPAEREEIVGGEHRSLRGHCFISPNLVESAIVNTSLGLVQGLGVYQLESANLLSQTPKQANLVVYSQQVFGTVGFANRVGIDLRARGLAAVGGDLNDVLVLGALASASAGGIAKVRLVTLEDAGFQMSVGAGFVYARTFVVTPAAIVGLGEKEDVEAAENAIVQDREGGAVRPVLMLAQGLGPLGAQASFGGAIPVAGNQSTGEIDGGIHLTLDLLPLTTVVPFALTSEYLAAHEIGDEASDEPLSHTFVGGLYYSGRQSFEPGLSVLYAPERDNRRLIVGRMVLQVYF